MQYVKGITSYADSADYAKQTPSAVTLGKFDGLHRGHQKLVDKVAELARQDEMTSIVCAFDMLPLYERENLPQKILMTTDERQQNLKDKVDYLVDCPFTEAFSKMEAEDFIKDVLSGIFHAAYVVVGADFCFGHDKRGDVYMLAAYAKQFGYELIVLEKERYNGREISSTYIKEALKEGNMELADVLLGYPYAIKGMVEHGKKLGRTLGFPTCNVQPAKEKIMPPNGVYLGRVCVEGKWHNAITNIGVKPTVTNQKKLLAESFLFDYAGNAYGKSVVIELHQFRRPEEKFADIEEMKRCIDEDIAFGKAFLTG